MNNIPTLASALHRAALPGMLMGPADAPRRHYGLATLRDIVATWRWRTQFRWELEQKSRDNPHFVDDIGLTKQQVEAEIAKRFWQR